jgi:hypothetical protein
MKATPIRRLYRAAACFFVALAFSAYHNGSCFAFADGDFQFWSTTGVSFDIHKDWTVAVQEHLKFFHGASHLRYHNTDLGFTYMGLVDWMDIGFNYKQAFLELRDGHWIRENRPHLNITFKGRLGSLDFSDRSRIEYRDKEYVDDLWRYVNKFEVNLPFELTQFKFRPYIADQVYINMDGSGFEKNRVYTGVTFELLEDIESELYYVRQWSEFLGQWQELSALGLQLKFRF